MGWASRYIADLQEGKTVRFRPHGNSMSPKIESGQLCTVAPLISTDELVGTVVLCKVRGREYLHYVKAVRGAGENRTFQIGNAKGHINGWVGQAAIFGVLMGVEA
jgi:hypothetical protein